jgi:hypothetical protein
MNRSAWQKVSYAQIQNEIETFRSLLKQIGLGDEIESYYTTPRERAELTDEEQAGLSSRARAYIELLEDELSAATASNRKMKGTIRKTNWGRRR